MAAHDNKADRDAEFSTFVVRATPSLMRLALLLSESPHAAQELVQATLVRLYQAWPRVAAGTSMAYARRALVNQRTDTWRRSRRETLTGALPDAPAPAGPDLSELDRVRALLRHLPVSQQKVVVLRFYADLSEQSTADALGMSVSAVKSATHRALTTLRAQVANEQEANR